MNDLRQHLANVWDGVEHSIIHNAIDQWCGAGITMPVFEQQEDILNKQISQHAVNCSKFS